MNSCVIPIFSIVWLVCNAVVSLRFRWMKEELWRWHWTPNNLWTRGGSWNKINQFEGYFGHLSAYPFLRYSSSESGVGKHCNVRELYVNSSFSPSSQIVTSRKFSDCVGRTRYNSFWILGGSGLPWTVPFKVLIIVSYYCTLHFWISQSVWWISYSKSPIDSGSHPTWREKFPLGTPKPLRVVTSQINRRGGIKT